MLPVICKRADVGVDAKLSERVVPAEDLEAARLPLSLPVPGVLEFAPLYVETPHPPTLDGASPQTLSGP